jgi:hypothetical protein
MRSLLRTWRTQANPIRSVAVEASAPIVSTEPTQFTLLVRHLLDRFLNNEMLSIGGETLPLLMTIAGAIAIPTLIAAIFVFPAYHAMPPRPPIPSFWNRTSEHLFYVTYSLVVMGMITVFEADILFPNPLDVLVLSTLPIPHRRIVLARVSTTLLFLTLFLVGVNSLGIVAYPIATEFHAGSIFLAQLISVTAAGVFSAAMFLAIQGMLICLSSGPVYRVVSTILQGVSVAVLMTILFSFPSMYALLPQLVTPAGAALRYYPPFWFLGIYEYLLAGSSALPAFSHLALIGWRATALATIIAISTYPLAYVRRTRQAIEGTAPQHTGTDWALPFKWLLHKTILRDPARRAIYHFISQTIRTPRHRVYLAMYTGLGASLMFACTAVIQMHGGRLHLVFSTYGLQAQVPGVAFWAVAGLCSALVSPADPRGGWVFQVIHGSATAVQLNTVKLWVTTRALAVTLAVIAVLFLLSPPELRHHNQLVTQFIVGTGLCLLLPDVMLLRSRIIPFTETRIPLNTDLAFILLRYIVVLPAIVGVVVNWEPWISATISHQAAAVLFIAAAHASLTLVHRRLMLSEPRAPSIAELNGTIEPLLLRE